MARIAQGHVIASNALVMWTARVVLVIPQLLLVPFLMRTIGEEGFGVYALVLSLLFSIDQLEKSLQSGVVKYCAGFIATGRVHDINRVVSSSFIYSCAIGVTAAIFVTLGQAAFGNSDGPMAVPLLMVAVGLLFILPVTPYVAFIQAQQRFYVGAVADTVTKYIGAGAVVLWFTMWRPSVDVAVGITVCGLFVSRVVHVPLAHQFAPQLRNSPTLFDRVLFRQMVGFGLGVFGMGLCLAINDAGIRWLMGALVSASFVAHLAILITPGQLLLQVVSPMTMVAFPAASAFHESVDREALQRLLVVSTKYVVVLLIACLMGGVVLLDNAIVLWVGREYSFLASYAAVLAATSGIMWSTSVAHQILKGMGRLRTVFVIYAVCLAFVPVTTALVAHFAGASPHVAVVLALSLGHVLCAVANLVACSRAAGLRPGHVLRISYLRPVVTAVPFAIATAGFATVAHDGVGAGLLTCVPSCLLYLVACYHWVLTAEERIRAREFLELIRRRGGLWSAAKGRARTADSEAGKATVGAVGTGGQA